MAVGLRRNLQTVPGTAVHRMTQLADRVDWRAPPPRVRVNHALIDVMFVRIAGAGVAGAYSALSRTCFSLTKPDRVARTLAGRARVPGRALIEGMLTDLRDGVCSVLERGYVRTSSGRTGCHGGAGSGPGSRPATAQDVRYEEYDVVVELDGRAIHDNPDAWDDDARRDLAELATGGAVTARVTYGLVFREACSTAAWIALILRRRGWTGPFVRCPACLPDLPPGLTPG